MNFKELVPVLQMATGPVILISGVGLLLLSMTNRYGRVIDRARHLCAVLRSADEQERRSLISQLDVLTVRARLIRACITLASLSVLLASLLIIALFVIALMQLELAWVLVVLFVSCLATLIASLVYFLRDINLSLSALRFETEAATTKKPRS